MKGSESPRVIGRNTPAKAETRFILHNLKAYDTKVHRECEDDPGVWHGQRDAT